MHINTIHRYWELDRKAGHPGTLSARIEGVEPLPRVFPLPPETLESPGGFHTCLHIASPSAKVSLCLSAWWRDCQFYLMNSLPSKRALELEYLRILLLIPPKEKDPGKMVVIILSKKRRWKRKRDGILSVIPQISFGHWVSCLLESLPVVIS